MEAILAQAANHVSWDCLEFGTRWGGTKASKTCQGILALMSGNDPDTFLCLDCHTCLDHRAVAFFI